MALSYFGYLLDILGTFWNKVLLIIIKHVYVIKSYAIKILCNEIIRNKILCNKIINWVYWFESRVCTCMSYGIVAHISLCTDCLNNFYKLGIVKGRRNRLPFTFWRYKWTINCHLGDISRNHPFRGGFAFFFF